MYPASYIRRRLAKDTGYYRDWLGTLAEKDHEAQTKAAACLKEEDDLVERAAQLLTSKETTAEEVAAFLDSEDFARLEAARGAVAELRASTLREATEAYARLDDDIQALDGEMAQLDPQVRADPTSAINNAEVAALRAKIQRKQQKEKVKVISKKAYRELKKKQQGLQEGVGANPDEVDPNEPVYCRCQRVSYGSMIGCDNEDCRFEWFHLECVGLTAEPPKGTPWMCPECSGQEGPPIPPPPPGILGGAAAGAGEAAAAVDGGAAPAPAMEAAQAPTAAEGTAQGTEDAAADGDKDVAGAAAGGGGGGEGGDEAASTGAGDGEAEAAAAQAMDESS